MNSYILLIALISISAAFAYVNHRYIKMPFVIGLFFLSTIVSLIVIATSSLWISGPYNDLKYIVGHTNISKFIIDIMLGFLLFAGSLHTNWANIKQQLKQIALLALLGVALSTLMIAGMFYGLTMLIGTPVDVIYCLLFGALISPTDPIAVIGILTKAQVPKKIETTIVGESLFNDGVGVVIFIALLEILNSGNSHFSFSHLGLLFIQEAIGGVIFGLIAGLVLYRLLKSIDHYETEVLLTLAFVMFGYFLANKLHVSGALAMVIMGLLIGNYKQELAMSTTTHEYVHKFWELLDVILNSILFILIALVIVVIEFKIEYMLLGLISIIIVLLSRIIVVYLPKLLLPKVFYFSTKEARIIVWGGLRGGLSIALVLSLPDNETKHMLLVVTYCCVLFSILVQGLTIEKLSKNWLR